MIRYPTPVNDRPQDLFLLGKNHYACSGDVTLAEAARRIVAFHNLYDISHMSWRDAARVVANDLLPLLAESLKQGRLGKFLIELGPDPILDRGERPGGYFAKLIEALLSEISMLRVYEDQVLLIPFTPPATDPQIQALIDHPNPTQLRDLAASSCAGAAIPAGA